MKSFAVLLLILSSATCAVAQTNTQRGAVTGGLTGAALGAIIGDHNDEAGEGALIGGALGLLAGSTLGNAADQDERRAAMFYQQQVYASRARAVSINDAVAMTQNQLSQNVIIGAVRSNGLQRRLEVADIVYLHNSGVSDSVILAMQQAPVAGTVQAVARPPVAFERYPAPVCYGPPVYRVPHHHYYGPSCRRYPRSGFHASFGGY